MLLIVQLRPAGGERSILLFAGEYSEPSLLYKVSTLSLVKSSGITLAYDEIEKTVQHNNKHNDAEHKR